ncbi:MAG: arginase [Bacteroidia bacterium]
MSRLHLLEVKSELGAGTRGASLGVDAVKIAAHDFASRFFHKLPRTEVPNRNDLLYGPEGSPFARYIKGVGEVMESVRDAVQACLEQGSYPLILAGDHSTSAGSLAGIRKAYPDQRLGVVWIDAHADLHSPWTTPSGNMHGMPLALALGEDHTTAAVREPDPTTVKRWRALQQMAGTAPMLRYQDLVYIALRDLEPQESALIRENRVKVFTVAELRRKGVERVALDALEALSSCDVIYVSFDVDSLDSKLSQGTGTPVPGGINEREAGKLLQNLVRNPKVCCFEMVEINPTLDKENLMAEMAFEILVKVANAIDQQLPSGKEDDV